jgi:hypothetical protein
MATCLDVVTDALQEIGVYAPGEVPSGADAEFARGKLNRILGTFNAQKLWAYASVIASYDLVASTQSRTIGPTGNYVVTPRPVRILNANLVNGSTRTPIEVRDSAWWMNITNRSITGLPTHLYYETSNPNGTLYFWPIPDSSSYDVELETRVVLSELASLATTFTFPPGYQEALTLSLAEGLCAPFGRPLDAKLAEDARRARAAVQSLNSRPPRINLDVRQVNFNIQSGDF